MTGPAPMMCDASHGNQHNQTNITALVDTEVPRSRQLTGVQTASLKVNCVQVKKRGTDPPPSHAKGGHGHGERSKSMFTAIAAAVINYFLMFGLCCAYGMIMFNDSWHSKHVALGVKMNLGTAFLCGLLLSVTSKVPVAIGGPDLNPVVILGGMVQKLGPAIAESLDLTPVGRRLAPAGGSSEKYCHERFCVSPNDEACMLKCEDYDNQLRATAIFTTAFSSAVLGLIFFLIGKLRLARYVSYVPTSIQEAFLSCIGYKVFKYAIKFSKYEPLQFVPAACVGVPLYFMKAYHIGNPVIVLPLGFLMLWGLFYAITLPQGHDLDYGRDDRSKPLFFPELSDSTYFYQIWISVIPNFHYINFSAWSQTFTDLLTMIVVVTLDCMLKISSTENKLPITCDKNYEIKLYGAGNFLMAACGSSVGYMQLKFNVIAHGIMGNVEDRRGGALYAILCGVSFFWTIAHFNFMPRVLLSSLLFFAGAGFVCENLWGSRKYLSFVEWLQVLVILLVFAFTENLLIAVLIGICMTCIMFIKKYAEVPAVSGRAMSGTVLTREHSGQLTQRIMQHIGMHWLLLLRLKGFVFFGSVHAVINMVRERMQKEEDDGIPKYRRLKVVIFDCEMLDGLDASAAKALQKLALDADKQDVRVVFSSITRAWATDLVQRGIIDEGDWFEDYGDAVLSIEYMILDYWRHLHSSWVHVHPAFVRFQALKSVEANFAPFHRVLESDAGRAGCPWRYCRKVKLHKYKTLLWEPGEASDVLYLVHTGAVGFFTKVPSGDGDEQPEWEAPISVYRHGSFVNGEALMQVPHHYAAVALEDGEAVCWDTALWRRMERERPRMAGELLRALLRQSSRQAALRSNAPSEDIQVGDNRHGAGPAEFRSGGDMKRTNSQLSTVENTDLSISVCNAAQNAAMRIERARLEEKIAMLEKERMPHELQVQIMNMSACNKLGKEGFFEPVPDTEVALHPEVSPRLKEDLQAAFVTHCTLDEDTGSMVMPFSKVPEALMYAGIHYARIKQVAVDQDFVQEDSFMILGREAAMAKFNSCQLAKVDELFQSCGCPSDAEALAMALKQKLFPNTPVSVSEIDGVILCWVDALTGKVDQDIFRGIVSRLVKKHVPIWDLLQGILEVVQEDTYEAATRITSEHLDAAVEKAFKNSAKTRPEANELLWAADWRKGGDTEALEFVDVLSVVCSLLNQPTGKLMTSASLAELERRVGTPSFTPFETGAAGSFQASAMVTGYHTSKTGHYEAQDMFEQSRREQTLEDLDAAMSELKAAVPVRTPEVLQTCRAKLHRLLEDPNSSRAASLLSLLISLMITVSVMTLVLQPVIEEGSETNSSDMDVWLGFEVFFTIVFGLEYFLRLSVANALGNQTTCEFLVAPSNICDIAAILPLPIDLLLEGNAEELSLLKVVRLIVRLTRVTRMARVARIARHSSVAAPVSMVLVVIWGIYLSNQGSEKA